MTLRRQHLILGALVVVVSLGVAASLLWVETRPARTDALRLSVESDLRVARELASAWDEPDFQALALRLSEFLDHRVSVIAFDGEVLGESHVSAVGVSSIENHRDRPEVQEAIAARVGFSQRRSATLGEDQVYGATLTEIAGRTVVLRIARPTPAPPISFPVGIWVLVAIALGGLGLLWLGGLGIEGGLRVQVGHLIVGIRAIGDGDLAPRPVRSDGPPELAELGGALHVMGERLEDRLAELEGQRNEMQALIDSIAEGVIALTDDARVLRMNSAAAESLEISHPPQFAPIGTLVRHPELRDYLEESVILPLPPREVHLGDRHLLVSSYLLEEGGSVVTFLDVTQLRHMETVRRDFVANASHELKTPLTSMRGFAETLLEDDPPEHLRTEFLRSIRNNTVRLQYLVDDLLDLSRLESGGWTTAEEEVVLAETVWEVWDQLSEESPSRLVDFEVEGDARVLADLQALHQIFRNLFENALRYTPEGGRIRVLVTPDGPFARVAVSDSGGGIPSSSLPRIFERFFRVDSGRDRSEGGTGLGLAIVRHLVQSMGGEVSADSRLGQGTTIRFSVPRVEARKVEEVG